MSVLRALVLLVALVVAGCRLDVETIAPKEELEIGRSFVELLRQQEFETIEQVLTPELQTAETRKQLELAAAAFPLAEPQATKLLDVTMQRLEKQATYNFTFEYRYTDTWVVTRAAFRRDADGIRIIGISGHRLQVDPMTLNRFEFRGKSPLHFLMLLLLIGIPVLVVVTLVAAWRARFGIGQWLWYPFIAIGFGTLRLNWNSGEWQFAPLSVSLLGATYEKIGYGPWMLSVGVPVGAVLFWVRRARRRRAAIVSAAQDGGSVT